MKSAGNNIDNTDSIRDVNEFADFIRRASDCSADEFFEAIDGYDFLRRKNSKSGASTMTTYEDAIEELEEQSDDIKQSYAIEKLKIKNDILIKNLQQSNDIFMSNMRDVREYIALLTNTINAVDKLNKSNSNKQEYIKPREAFKSNLDTFNTVFDALDMREKPNNFIKLFEDFKKDTARLIKSNIDNMIEHIKEDAQRIKESGKTLEKKTIDVADAFKARVAEFNSNIYQSINRTLSDFIKKIKAFGVKSKSDVGDRTNEESIPQNAAQNPPVQENCEGTHITGNKYMQDQQDFFRLFSNSSYESVYKEPVKHPHASKVKQVDEELVQPPHASKVKQLNDYSNANKNSFFKLR